MSLLTPIGLLGFIGLVILFIIYIIKPNYQNKIISSTYVWTLSLKYRKKKLPISKLRNLILILCQVLILSIAAFLLAQPFIPDNQEDNGVEKVMIIDVSASMLAETGGETRIERAVDLALTKAEAAMEANQKVSVIVASDESYYLVQNAGTDRAEELYDAINSLIDPAEPKYTFGTPDIAGAISLAEEITAYSADSEVLLYTDTEYIDKGRVTVVDCSDVSDWNAAILDVRATMVDNYYVFEIDVACYGIDTDVLVSCDISGVNYESGTVTIDTVARCSNNEVTTLVFSNYVASENGEDSGMEEPDEVVSIYSYETIYVHLTEDDSLEYDNVYYLYGGTNPTLNVQYYSSLPNNFFSTALMVLRDQLSDRWDMKITEVKYDEVPATEGFDIYIYEHTMPATLPIDGIIIVADPDQLPSSSGIRLGSYWAGSMDLKTLLPLAAADEHPLMKNITPSNIEVALYRDVQYYNPDEYTVLMTCQDNPVVLVKEQIDQKMVVMGLNLNYSNFSMLLDFPLFMYNIFEYFSPATITDRVYEVNDTVSLNSRGDELFLVGPGTDAGYKEFPANVTVTKPGVYTATQILISGEEDVQNFYVKLAAEESNTNLTVDMLENPFFYEGTENNDLDLLLYFAIALVSLLFIEWWLKSREQL